MFEVIRVPWTGIPTAREKAEFFETLRVGLTKPCLAASFNLVHDWHLAEECVQTAFIILWEKLFTLQPKTDVTRWLFAAVRNRGLKVVAKQAREIILDPDCAAALLEKMEGNRRVSTDIDRSDELIMLLDELSAHERAALVLRHANNLSHTEIASFMGCDIGTVRCYLHRARKRLARLIGGRRVASAAGAAK
jgi:RNA polymerase sigma-70 factor (ECF subfamily)